MEALILFSSLCVIGLISLIAVWIYDRNHHRPQHP